MASKDPSKDDTKRRATTILATGIASLVLFPLAVILAPVTWVLAYRNRALRGNETARGRWTAGVALAGLGAIAFVVFAVAVPSSSVTKDDQAAATTPTEATTAAPAPAAAPATTSTPPVTATRAATTAVRSVTAPPTQTAPRTTATRAAPAPTTTREQPTRTTTPRAPAPRTTTTRSTPDPAEVAQRFYLRTDDDAIALDDAIGAQLDGQNKVATIERIRKRILNRLNDRLLDGGDVSIATNLLISAGAQARDAARSDDLPRLVDARREVASARSRLAGELKG